MTIKDSLINPTAPGKDNDILIPGGDIPSDRPVTKYYDWYYRVAVRDESGTHLSGVKMYDSSDINVGTSNNSGRISYHAGRTTSLNNTFFATFTFKKSGYEDKRVKITATTDTTDTTDTTYTPVIMSKKQAVIDEVYFDIFVKDGSNDLPISGATINVYADSNYSVSFTAPFKTNDNGFGGISTKELPVKSTLYFQVSAIGYASIKTPVIGTAFRKLENEDSIVRLIPKTAIAREYFFNIKVWDSSQNPVPGVRLRLYKDFSLSTTYSNGTVDTHKDGLYEIAERIKDIIFSKVDLDISILNDEYKLIDAGVDSLSAVEIITEIEKIFNITISDDEVKRSSTILDVARLVQGKLPNGSIDKTYAETDKNGEIHIKYGLSTTKPNPLGVKIVNLPKPKGYYISNPIGTVTALPLGSTKFGKTFILQKRTTVLPEYSYNFQLLDRLAYVKLSDVNVVYKNPNGDEIYRGITDSEGQINFTSSYPNLTISFSKNGYEDYEVYSFAGSVNKNDRSNQRLMPTRYIRVVNEETGDGVEDITVILWGYDQNGDYIEYKSLKTRYGGYVSPNILNENSGLYNAEVYVSIYLKYTYDASYNKNLKKIPLENIMVFEIPSPKDDGDSDVDEFENFNEY